MLHIVFREPRQLLLDFGIVDFLQFNIPTPFSLEFPSIDEAQLADRTTEVL